jgi:hypothetical protein
VTFKYWESAAEAVLGEIYSLKWSSRGIEELRLHLDGVIHEMWTPEVGDKERVRQSWLLFGAMARSFGEINNFSIFSEGPEAVHAIVCRKQRDYGHTNISRFGRQGLMVRLHDKVARLENLFSSRATPNNESIEDNIIDLIGYACIAMMWEDKTFLLPCYTSTVAESSQQSSISRSMNDILAKNGLAPRH